MFQSKPIRIVARLGKRRNRRFGFLIGTPFRPCRETLPQHHRAVYRQARRFVFRGIRTHGPINFEEVALEHFAYVNNFASIRMNLKVTDTAPEERRTDVPRGLRASMSQTCLGSMPILVRIRPMFFRIESRPSRARRTLRSVFPWSYAPPS